MGEKIRLQRYLATAGVAARRKAEELIVAGRVRVNGKQVRLLGTKVDAQTAHVTVDGEAVTPLDTFYVILNKPKGCVSAVEDDRDRPTVMEYLPNLPIPVRPVGRLDFYTEGVLLLTNDGELASRLVSPQRHIARTYHVKVRGEVSREHLDALRGGVRLEDGSTTMPAEINVLPGESRHSWLAVTLVEPGERVVQNMFEALGYQVQKLQRVAYASLNFHGLRVGDARELNQTELNALRDLVELDHRPTARGVWRSSREETDLTRRALGRVRAEAELAAAPPQDDRAVDRDAFASPATGQRGARADRATGKSGQGRDRAERVDRVDRGPRRSSPAARSDFGRPSSGRPSSGRPSTGRPSAARPSAGRPSAGRPSTGRPSAGRPSAGRPSAGRPSAGRPSSDRPTFERGSRPSAGRPSAGRPSAGRPSGDRPTFERAGRPSTGRPSAARPSSDRPTFERSSRPSTGRPSTGRPSAGRPSTGRPSSDRPTFERGSRPSTGRPSAGRPSGDRPAFERGSRPSTGRPSAGRPSTGRPSSDRPTFERSSRPSAGRPSAGRPSAARPSQERASSRPGRPGRPASERPVRKSGSASPGKPARRGRGPMR
jgi:23S rRNA pseudouridine2605 synthase